MRPPLTLGATGAPVRVATIMDPFTFQSFNPECDLLQLTPDDWPRQLADFKPDILFVESAWRGKSDLWNNRLARVDFEVSQIVGWFRDRSIPTAFWNKEDPVHFTTFLNTAALFDNVFTTDLDSIPRYKEALGHQRVFLLPFATQPSLFNPMNASDRIDAFCFAGAYYARYPKRAQDLEAMVEELTALRPFLIYDRNYGQENQDYAFPAKYMPFILGHLPYEKLDRAYKGYRYSINMNSVSQSQTMCARRVFELLGSGSTTLSNYSRAIRLLFGDLVISADSAAEISRRVAPLMENESLRRKTEVAGLRKVLSSHTYSHRLAYILSKAFGENVAVAVPETHVIARVRSALDADHLLAAVSRQVTAPATVSMVTDPPLIRTVEDMLERSRVESGGFVLSSEGSDPAPKTGLIAPMVPNDYYGPYYLNDLVQGTAYVHASVLGKAAHYASFDGQPPRLRNADQTYQFSARVAARRSVATADRCEMWSTQEIASLAATHEFAGKDVVALDEYNYCEGPAGHLDDIALSQILSDVDGIDEGWSYDRLIAEVESTTGSSTADPEGTIGSIDARQLLSWFDDARAPSIQLLDKDGFVQVRSTLDEDQFGYLWSGQLLDPSAFGLPTNSDIFFGVETGILAHLALRFYDDSGKKLGSAVLQANKNETFATPAGTTQVEPGIRASGPGHGAIISVLLGHKRLVPPVLLTRADHLVVTDNYPSYDDLYRNAFLHRRVLAYKARGLGADVFRLRARESVSYHEYENIDCITGEATTLKAMLERGTYKSVMVHFMNPDMWDAISPYLDKVRVNVWVHGSEVQPWHRRKFNLSSQSEIDRAIEASDRRMAFWKQVMSHTHPNLRFVFVSRYFADEVMEDVGVELPGESYEVIHNPIDTDLFAYVKKPEEQRFRILSIRPFTSRKYANDLSVAAIAMLQNEPWFSEAEFRIVGSGPLFESVLDPIAHLENVITENRFLSQTEIATLHREYGVFLCPTRMDSQGVSRDEAMASGLVPVTNAVAAVPEFVNEMSGFLAPAEDHAGLADAIRTLVTQPNTFEELSRHAAERVRAQSSMDLIIRAELELIAASSTSQPGGRD